MIKFNLHSHTTFSDGLLPMEDLANCASGHDLQILGISDHAPAFFHSKWNMKYHEIKNYISQFNLIKKQISNLHLLLGMEVDFFPNLKNNAYFLSFGLDYTIGSVHYLDCFPDQTPFNIDSSAQTFLNGLKIIFNNNPKSMAELYYSYIIQMLKTDPPTILGHINIIEKFNFKLNNILQTDKLWYKQLLEQTIIALSKTQTILEINARPWYLNLTPTPLPDKNTIQLAVKHNIPITISGDVHKPEEFGMYWNDTIEYAKYCGVKYISYLDQNAQIKSFKI